MKAYTIQKNNKFNTLLKAQNISIYQLANATGVPYTNLNKLKNGKQDINNCSGKDLYKLAHFFNCAIEDLLNPIPCISHSRGLYRSIKYQWIPENSGITLQILENKKYTAIDHIKSQRYISEAQIMQGLAEVTLDAYIEAKEIEDALGQLNTY